MSMISSQIDELRRVAQTYRDFGKYEAERMALDAADTIWQLRDDLQRANAENDKLREELVDAPKCEACEAMLDCDECLRADGSHKERRQLSSENAKLRELVRLFLRCNEFLCEGCPLNEQGACGILEKVEEVGIEVDDGD